MRSKKPNPYIYNFKCIQNELNCQKCQKAIPPILYFRKPGPWAHKRYEYLP